MYFMNDSERDFNSFSCLQGLKSIQKLGEGRTGNVFLAEEQGKYVAVKIGGPWKYLQREAQMMQEIDHTGIPAIYSAEKAMGEEDYGCLVMEYIQGDNLERLMHLYPNGMPFLQAERIAIQLLQILKGLHTGNIPIVHRDLKPSNIMIGKAEKVYLLDFGAATHTGASEDFYAGTLGYGSPEQFWPKAEIGCSSDIYSFAKVYLAMLTGLDPSKPPFPNDLTLLHAAKISRKIRDFLKICLSIPPEGRFYAADVALEEYRKIQKDLFFNRRNTIVYEKNIWMSNWKKAEEESTDYFDFSAK